MSANPFDDDTLPFYALVNHEQQYSLWPVFAPVPQGWSIAYGAPDGAPRQDVLDWIDANWDDLLPLSARRHRVAAHAQYAEEGAS